MGRPLLWMGFEPGFSFGRPCDGPGCAASADPSMSFARLVLPDRCRSGGGVGVRESVWTCTAISARSRSRAGRVAAGRSRRAGRAGVFAATAGRSGGVGVTGNAWEIARIRGACRSCRGHRRDRDRAGPREDRPAGRSRAGEAAGDGRARRGVDARRTHPGHAPAACASPRSSCRRAASTKNEIHAVLMRRLKGRPPASDSFGVKGRAWLAEPRAAAGGARDRRRRRCG